MSATQQNGWGLFWALFGAGWALFAFLVVTNGRMVTAASPRGILDHQVAGSAARVDEIQAAWAAGGALDFARLSIGTDLLFIGVLTVAGVLGGVQIARASRGPILRAIGWFAALGFLVFGGADYTETIAQFIQVTSRGIEPLAQLAETANRPKVTAFLAGHVALFAGLIGVFVTRPKVR